MLNLLSKGLGDIAKYNWEYHDMADEGLYKNSFCHHLELTKLIYLSMYVMVIVNDQHLI